MSQRSFACAEYAMKSRVSYVAAPLFFISMILLAHFRFSRMDASTFATEAYTLYLPLSAALLFASAYGLALIHRRTPRLHGCLMLCTALILVDPVVGRRRLPIS